MERDSYWIYYWKNKGYNDEEVELLRSGQKPCRQCCKPFKKISKSNMCSDECREAQQTRTIELYKKACEKRQLEKIKCEICGKGMTKKSSVMVSHMICSEECNVVRKNNKPKKLSVISKQYWINLGYSEEEATEIVSIKQSQRSKRHSLYWTSRGYSDEEAKEKVSEHQTSITKMDKRTKEQRSITNHRSLSYWMTQGFSAEEAREKHRQFNNNNTLEKYIVRYGEELGKQKFEEAREKQKKANSLNGYIDRHGESVGLINWASKYQNRTDSKSANKFFKDLYDLLPEEIKATKVYFKGHNKEFGSRGLNNNYYFYDFVISDLKFCIEYNGTYWHADPRTFESGDYIKFPNNNMRLVDDIWNYDTAKNKILEDRGFVVKTIWMGDKECRYKENIDKVINECLEEIIKRYGEYNEKSNDTEEN